MKSKRAVAVSLVGLLVIGSAVAYAQGNAPGMPDVLGQILTAVQGVQTGVTSILAKLDAPPPAESNVLQTAPLVMETGLLTCPFTNISATAQDVQIRVLNSSGQLVSPGAHITYGSIPPGGGGEFGVGNGVATGLMHCEFTVVGGASARATLRASIQLAPPTGNTTVALPAE